MAHCRLSSSLLGQLENGCFTHYYVELHTKVNMFNLIMKNDVFLIDNNGVSKVFSRVFDIFFVSMSTKPGSVIQ